jgi:uncharacterized RDD family membrane protein YckC
MKNCPSCHAECSDEMTFCGHCGTPLVAQQNPAPAPAAVAPLGSLGARLLAHLIDGAFVLIPAFFLLGSVYSAYFGGLSESGFNLTGLPALEVMAAVAVVFFLYLTLFEGVLGATAGKFILGLRVKSVEGASCGFRRALVRNLLRLIDGIAVYLVALIAALTTKKKQRLGDLAGHTIVVQEPTGRVKQAAASLFLLACVVGAIWGSLYVRRHPRVPVVTFGITNVRFADSETAPPRASAEFKPSEKLRLFYNVRGYDRDSGSNMAVVTHNRALAPDGKPFFEDQVVEVRQKVDDTTHPVQANYYIDLPFWAPPGRYTINIESEDRVAHKTTSSTASFTVNGPAVETSTTFVARSIEVANSLDGPALNPPVLNAGQSLCLRFRMLGMKADGKGQIRLTGDWSLSGPDGKAVFEKNEDSIVDRQLIYTPPFIPYGMAVDIPPSADPGDYKFHVVLHDKIAGADFTIDQPLKIQKP